MANLFSLSILQTASSLPIMISFGAKAKNNIVLKSKWVLKQKQNNIRRESMRWVKFLTKVGHVFIFLLVFQVEIY